MKQSLLILSFLFSVGAFTQTDTATSTLEQYIFAVHERVINDPSMQTDYFNPQDTASLPIGMVKQIGNVIYAICIDSAFYTPEGSYFNVYMAMDFPGAERKIAFAAKHVQFNPEGVLVSQGTRLQLVSKQTVNLGPNAQLVFKDDGMNFVEWDCNGYKQAGLSLDIVLNPSVVINANNPSLPVKAGFQMVVEDLENISINIPQIDPFKVRGAEDFVFALSNISIDRSSTVNPYGIILPQITTQLYNGDLNEWKGFYARDITVTLPQKLSRTGQATSIYAHNMIIDDSGVTGAFGATNLFETNESTMSGWGFSINALEVALVSNHLTGGSIGGDIQIPILDQPLAYTAVIEENITAHTLDYTFAISPTANIIIPVPAFSSEVQLHPTSVIQVQSIAGEFRPKAILNGKWTITRGTTKVKGVSFQDLTVIHTAPVITQGMFSLIGSNADSNKLMRFPISLNSLGFYTTTTGELLLQANMSVNLGNEPNTFSVAAGFSVVTQRTTNQGRTNLAFNQFQFNDIMISLHTTPFDLDGVIAVRKDDPTFGDLFYGSIAFRLKNIGMDNPAMVSVGFGKLPDYKYWFVDAAIPVNIPVTPTVSISQLYGGVMNRVSTTTSDQQVLNRVIGAINNPSQGGGTPNSVIPFVPDANRGLEFRAGVALQNIVREELFNAEAMFCIAFNPNGGFASINFYGQAYMLVARAQRASPSAQKVYGTLAVGYDNNAKVLDAQLDAVMYVPNLLQGNMNLKLHISPGDWYFWLNRPASRANLSLVGLFNVNAYFMIGTQIDPLPPPPSCVTQLVGSGSFVNIDQTALSTGNGFLAGMQFSSGFDRQFHLAGNWYGYASAAFGAGFDVMMMKVSPTAHCQGSSDPIGINRWYCMGQVYGYLNGGLGARRIVDGNITNEFNIISLSAAFLLQGRLPKPTFVYGAVGMRFEFLTIDITVNADVSFGNDCTIIY